MRKIAVAMAKGGVGKTTTAVSLAHGLALSGARVVLIDCDTQAQASGFLGVHPEYGLYEFVAGEGKDGSRLNKAQALYPARDNLWLIAGGVLLVELKNRLGEQPAERRHSVLAEALIPRDESVDYLIFDCSPGWDVLSVNILMAADEVMCPVSMQGPALAGLKMFFTYLLSAQRLNPALRLKYVVPTMFDRRTRHSYEILSLLEKHFVRQLCDPVGYSTGFSEAASGGKTIFEYRPGSPGAEGYRKLIRRVTEDDVKQEKNA